MDLNELRKNILDYQSKLQNYIDILLNHKQIVNKIKSEYGKRLNEKFYSPSPSIQIDSQNEGYTIYIQLTIDDHFFGLWCTKQFEKSHDCDDHDPSILIKFFEDDKKSYDSILKSFKARLPEQLKERLQDIEIILDPYSIHFIIHILDEEEDNQPELPGVGGQSYGNIGDEANLYMTMMEYTKLISTRARLMESHDDMGPTIDISTMAKEDQIDPIRISIEELRQKQFPLDLVRVLPNGREIIIDANEMFLPT
uniref:RNA polymerase subunit 6 n=1 Tax=Pithovirus LCPAC101 TaxID=2506586 RepID=A0A481Z2R1_9VIRU|nr:MAG: RNA polymerase subunit 6 [Pithovirus LCPAC101]